MPYKLIIFDFDGTLADSFGWFAANINQAAIKFKFKKVEPEEHEKLRTFDSKGIMRHLGISWWKVPFIASYMRKLMATEISKVSLFNNVDTLLNELVDRNIEIAIVSSNSKMNVLRILGEHAKHVKYFECGVSLFGKSSRFQKIIKKAGLKGPEVLCIGDEIRDIIAARKVNLRSGSVTWGYARPEALEANGPEYIFFNIDDITRIL